MKDFDSLWDYGDPAATARVFTGLLEREPEAPAAWRAELLTQLARTCSLQKRFEEAEEWLQQASAVSDLPRPRIRVLLERGRTLNSSGLRAEARPVFREAFETAVEAGEEGLAVDAAHMLGLAEEPEEAFAWNQRALEMARTSAAPAARRWRGSLLNNLGWTFHDRGDFAQALALFEEAVEARREQGQPKEERVARWCMARALRSLGRLEEALARQQELAGEPEDGFVSEEIGECLLALGRPSEAQPWFRQAFAKLSQDPWLEADRLERLRRLGDEGGEVGQA